MDVDVLNRDLLLAFAPMAVQGLDQTGGRPGQLIGLRTAGIHRRSSGALATPQASGFRVARIDEQRVFSQLDSMGAKWRQ
jgi:hypothetical protein